MMMLDLLPKVTLEVIVMHSIVHHIIDQVTKQKPWKERKKISLNTEEQREQEVKQCSQGDTCRRRHHQPLRIPRVVMVNTVKYKVDLLAPLRCRMIMENKP